MEFQFWGSVHCILRRGSGPLLLSPQARMSHRETTNIFCSSAKLIAENTIRLRWWHPTPVLLPGKSHGWRSREGWSPWGRWGSDTTERLPFHFSLSCIEKKMATHSSVLAWRIPGTGEPGGLLSMGSHRVGHYCSDLAAAAAWWELHSVPFRIAHALCSRWRRKWQPTPVFLPGKSHGWRSLVGYSPWGHKESDMTEVT